MNGLLDAGKNLAGNHFRKNQNAKKLNANATK
jgi:hypothetical protein